MGLYTPSSFSETLSEIGQKEFFFILLEEHPSKTNLHPERQVVWYALVMIIFAKKERRNTCYGTQQK